MRRNQIIPKHMYETYAPGEFTTGYYECPSCTKKRAKTFWCFDCNCAMVRKAPILKNINIHDFYSSHKKPKIIREIIT